VRKGREMSHEHRFTMKISQNMMRKTKPEVKIGTKSQYRPIRTLVSRRLKPEKRRVFMTNIRVRP
jgi:hypothetical protein